MRGAADRMGATRGDVRLLEPAPARRDRRSKPESRQLSLPLPLAGEGRGEGGPAARTTLTQPSPGERGHSSGQRTATLWRALLPAAALADWRLPFKPDTTGLFRLEPADQQEEAVAIALALRQALDRPHASAALVTPDRELALRVAAELGRYGIVVDDSAGESAGRHAARRLPAPARPRRRRRLAPVALLSVLKHPLAALRADPRRLPPRRPRAGAPLPARPGAAARRRRAPRRARRRPGRTRTRPTCWIGWRPASPPCSPSPTPDERHPGRGPARPDRDRRSRRQHPRGARRRPALGGRGRRGAATPSRRPRRRPADPAAAAGHHPARPAGRRDGGRGRAQPPRAARPRRRRASARRHPRPARGPAAELRRRDPGQPCRRRLAARDRSRPVDEPADAHRRRADLAGGARRPDGARFRHGSPAPPRPSSCPARAGGTAPPRSRPAGWSGSRRSSPATAATSPSTRRRNGLGCWTSRRAAPPRCSRRARARPSRSGRAR